MGRYLVEAHFREGRSVAELARTHGVHRSSIYKLLARHRAEGEAGLAPRSKRPHHSPTRVAEAVEDEIVLLRKRLGEDGLDAGALTISWHLASRGGPVPSVSSIWRVLVRRGFVVPQPAKRPKSSFVRFEASLPNECWQSDMTHWALADGTGVEIVNVVDDHSRFCVASVAVPRHPGHRRGRGPARGHRTPRGPGRSAHRQRLHLHGQAPGRAGGDRDPARVPRHRLQALEALPPADLRQGRAPPPHP